jgi:hypothetical protein
MWRPLRDTLVATRAAVVFDVVFHREMATYGDSYLRDRLVGKLALAPGNGVMIDDDELTVSISFVELDRIAAELNTHYAKCGTNREIQLITGQYRPLARFSSGVLGRREAKGDARFGPADYWSEVAFACGAFWSCDDRSAIERKARDIRGHLAKAIRQLKGDVRSTVHVGIETLDGQPVEKERYARMVRTVAKFDVAGTLTDWIYCHLLQPESPPDKLWDFAETTAAYRIGESEAPLRNTFLVTPPDNAVKGKVHWE